MPEKFEVAHVLGNKKDGFYVIARHLTPGVSFSVPGNAFLNGAHVKAGVSNAKATDKNGVQRTDLFVFYLRHGKDVVLFQKQKVVELTYKV